MIRPAGRCVAYCVLAYFGLLLPFPAIATPAQSQQKLALVERVQGDAQLERAGHRHGLSAGQTLTRYDRLRTAPAARLAVVFDDGSGLVLGESTVVVLEDYLPEEGRRAAALMLEIVTGAVRLSVSKPVKALNKRVEVRLPSGVLRLSSGEFWVGPADSGTGVVLISGKLDVRNEAGLVALEKARLGTVLKGILLAPDKPTTWSREKMNDVVRTVEFR